MSKKGKILRIIGWGLIIFEILGMIGALKDGTIQPKFHEGAYTFLFGTLLIGIVGIILLVIGIIIGKKKK